MELPPRARRIQDTAPRCIIKSGTTSACAENTDEELKKDGMTWELPPRARRILAGEAQRRTNQGTTSACAENTGNSFPGAIHFWNYLRVRGEYSYRGGTFFLSLELPPRARRILRISGIREAYLGTTSACAENTVKLLLSLPRLRNYLRVRGEYHFLNLDDGGGSELPPRARRIRQTARSVSG